MGYCNYFDNVTLDKCSIAFCKHGWEEHGFCRFTYIFFIRILPYPCLQAEITQGSHPQYLHSSREYRSPKCMLGFWVVAWRYVMKMAKENKKRPAD